MNAFILVVVTVIRTSARSAAEKICHFVLVEPDLAHVSVKIFVIIVELAAFAVRFSVILHSICSLLRIDSPYNADGLWRFAV